MHTSKGNIKSYLYAGLSTMSILSSLTLGTAALAATATFDDFAVGFSGTNIIDNGITFSNLNPGGDLSDTFFIDGTTADYLGAFFSAPNYLTFGGFTEDADTAFGAFNSATISTGTVGTAASLDLFATLFEPSNNTVTLTALLGSNVVASTSLALADLALIATSGISRGTLTISGVAFDELRLSADSTVFIGIDNVNVTAVPEPTVVLSLVAFGTLGAGLRRRRK